MTNTLIEKLEALNRYEFNSFKGDIEYVKYEDLRAIIEQTKAEQSEPVGWIRAVDEEMVLTFLGVAEQSDSYEVAKKKLQDIIQWNIAVATDPAVNGGYKLVKEGE